MAREVLLETLKENGGSAPLEIIERKLLEYGLGFGVRPFDVVSAAIEDGIIDYDLEAKIVSQTPDIFKLLTSVVLNDKTITVKWPENKRGILYNKQREYEVYKYDHEQKGLVLAPIGSLVPPRFLPLRTIRDISFVRQDDKVEITLSVTETLEP